VHVRVALRAGSADRGTARLRQHRSADGNDGCGE
jgi:hypothetical protein